MTKEELKAYVAEHIVENEEGLITASDLTTILNEVIDTKPEIKVVDLGTVEFDETDGFLTLEQMQSVWNQIYNHDVPLDVSELENDAKNTPLVYIKPFSAIGYLGGEYIFVGWQFVIMSSENNDSFEAKIYNPSGDGEILVKQV